MRRAWDAHSYDLVSTVSDPLIEEVLARLPLRGDETVLDAGCGTGRITARLLERLPRGRVIAVDLDPEMVSAARQRLPAGTTVIESADAVAKEPRWRDRFAAFTPNWYFATPAETEQRLTRSGFVETRCWLQSFVFTPPEPAAFLETMTLGSWVQLLPDKQRRAFAGQVAQRLGDPVTIENVRLNIDARRA